MKLGDLLRALPQKTIYDDPAAAISQIDICDITFDSRTVRPGSLFVAIRGWQQDGHRFIPDALRRGAAAIVAEEVAATPEEPARLVVPNSRQALALLAAAFYDFPAKQLRVVGVTGTDGKTTTTNLIGAMLNAAGQRAGMLSTIKLEYGGQAFDTGLHTTTPNPLDVQRYLREMVGADVHYAVLETTSHALDQDRTLGCEFDVALVTNVTPEHLDYHRTYGQYLATKGQLFAALARTHRKPGVPKVSVTNVDDISYGYLRQFPADLRLTYGIEADGDVTAQAIDLGREGIRFRAVTPRGRFEVHSPLLGRFNVYNMLAAIAAALAMDLPVEAIVGGAAAVGALTGRWERVPTGAGFAVIVDFAHTPHALEQALQLARSQATGRVIVVFGCAGLRDESKRPAMGEIAGRLADVVVLTAEDPRTEDVTDIMNQIGAGCRRAGRTLRRDYFQIGDRAEAIDFAVAMAGSGDLVLLTGKGHERSLCIGGIEHPWSEHDAVAAALAHRQAIRRRSVGEEMSE